jgi:hypothetical protein
MLQGERNSPITMIFRRGGGGDQIVVTLLRAGQGGPTGKAGAGAQPTKSAGAGPSIPSEEKSFLDSMVGLRSEFSSLSFLWGEPVSDAVQENMMDWKLNMLYGTFPPLLLLAALGRLLDIFEPCIDPCAPGRIAPGITLSDRLSFTFEQGLRRTCHRSPCRCRRDWRKMDRSWEMGTLACAEASTQLKRLAFPPTSPSIVLLIRAPLRTRFPGCVFVLPCAWVARV